MNSKLYVIVFLLGYFSGVCQNLNIQGNVKDIDNNPIAYANVILKSSNNLELITGTTTNEEGFFSIQNIQSSDYILEVSFLGYKKEGLTLKISKDLNIDDIVLKEDVEELSGVTITAKRPTVTRQVDRLVFNIENSTLSNDNVLNVLKQTPGVIIINNKITVKQTTPIVYINDRRVHLSIDEVQQLLEGTNANNVKAIEVITNPPAKYDAEGGSVLNIVMSKNIIAGYHGSVFGNYHQGFEFPKYSFGTSHFFKAKKLNTYLNYSISPRKDYRNIEESVNFFDTNNAVDTRWQTDYNRVSEQANNNINANIDYQINDNNVISLSSNLLISPRENTQTRVKSLTEVFDGNSNLDSLFDTSNNSVDEIFNLAFTLDYLLKLGKKGENIKMNLHHTNYDASLFQDVNTDYFFPDNSMIRNNRFQTFSSQIIKLYTAQADYELPINGKSFFEAGLKYSNINSESILDQFSFENGIRIEDFENSDNFLYDENNYAAYLSYAKDWDKWNLKMGLRGEWTEITGNSLVTNTINENDYFKLFPSFYLKHLLGDNDEIYLSYNKRIYRPRYRELNPFRFFLNDNTFLSGNPRLRPEIEDSFALGYSINNKFTFEAFYRYSVDEVLEINFQDNDDNLIKNINTNIDHSMTYGLDFLTYTTIVKNWNLYFLSSLYYIENNFFALESNNELVKNDRWNLYLQMINYFSFLKDKSLILDVAFGYLTPAVLGPRVISERYKADISLRKTFWHNKASLSIGVTDLFNTFNFSETTEYLNQDTYRESTLENRLFTLGFNYKFGNYRLKTNEKSIELKERDRLEK